MNDSIPKMMAAFRAAGQGHVFRWWDELAPAGRENLLAQLRQVDLKQLAGLADGVRTDSFHKTPQGRVERPEFVGVPRTADDVERRNRARAEGERLLRAGKVAALTVAGGQGTRLGYDAPKGVFPIGPVSQKSLFQIHAERVIATGRRYGRTLPWYIMTSQATDAATREYFRRVDYFGIPAADVRFFCQRMLPALDHDLRLVMTARDSILLSPNGHGGTLLALAECGMLDDMERRGVEQISYFQVDNPLVPAADPAFIGFHSLAGAEMSSKALEKRDPDEPLGAFVRVDGRLVVLEYSDLTPEEKRRPAPGGALLYGLGSIAIHVLRVDFVRHETAGGLKLPFHLASKSAACLNEQGERIEPKGKNVYKFETFIFDALADTTRSVILEIHRHEEFSPVKNAQGEDSPESCRRDMSALYASWLAMAGCEVPRDDRGLPCHPVEISPLYALDPGELAARLPRDLAVDGPIYLDAWKG